MPPLSTNSQLPTSPDGVDIPPSGGWRMNILLKTSQGRISKFITRSFFFFFKSINFPTLSSHFKGHELNPVPKLLKNLTGRSEMTMWENLLILKNKNQILVLNFEIPPCNVLIKKFILLPPDGGMSTPSGEVGSRELVDNGGTTPLKHVL